MTPDISEFSYGYALTEELIHSSGLPIMAAPLFPSLIQEGKTGGGYDVKIPFAGMPLFLQFKLADCMVRNTAWEVGRGLMTVPFYRMHIRPRNHSRQHELLLRLESNGEVIFYAAPHFHRPHELNGAYLSKQVINRSIFVKPSDIGPLLDDEGHHVSFHLGQDAYFCSEPRLLKNKDAYRQSFNNDLLEGYSTRRLFDGSRDSLKRLAAEMLSCVQEVAPVEDFKDGEMNRIEFLEPRFQIAYLARAYFGCELILIRPSNQ